MRWKCRVWAYTALVSLSLQTADAEAADVTVVSWGGDYTISQQKAYGETWRKKTGKTVRWVDYNGGLDEIRAQVKSANVLWDVVDVFPAEARIGCDEGLFEKLPRDRFTPAPDGTPMDQDLVVPLANDCVAPNIFWSWLIFYDKARYKADAPSTIADFFNIEKYPGKRGLSAFPQANIEMALVADGVDPKSVYRVMDTSEGIDRAFRKLNTIRPVAEFWGSGAEPIKFVKSGAVVMSTAYNGRVSDAILGQGAPFGIIWDGQVLDEEWFVIVKGTKRFGDALAFLVHATESEQLAAQAKWITYGPLRRSSLDIIRANEPWYHSGAAILPHMPNRAEVMPRTVVSNPNWWAKHGAGIGKRYKAWMGG